MPLAGRVNAMHRRFVIRVAAACAVTGILAACETAPVTGRSQFIVLSEDQAQEMGAQAYQQIVQQTPVSKDPQINAVVRRVGSRIAAVADTPDANWEYTVFQDSSPNAFALPGGKIGVNTGMFQVARNEAQLAAVLAHEVGHVIARHSAERVSRELALQTGLQVAGAAVSPATASLMAQAATLGLSLPFGRKQESEADEIGLMLMARAGYDPHAAVNLWQNMQQVSGNRQIEFLSTHPSAGSRIERLQSLMPKAMEAYRSATR